MAVFDRLRRVKPEDLVPELLEFANAGGGGWRLHDLDLPLIETLVTPADDQAGGRLSRNARFDAIEEALMDACRALETSLSEAALEHLGLSEAARKVSARTARENRAAQKLFMDGRTYRREMARGEYPSWLMKTITRVAEELVAQHADRAVTIDVVELRYRELLAIAGIDESSASDDVMRYLQEAAKAASLTPGDVEWYEQALREELTESVWEEMIQERTEKLTIVIKASGRPEDISLDMVDKLDLAVWQGVVSRRAKQAIESYRRRGGRESRSP